MGLTLPPDLAAFVRAEVAAGRYADEADVVRDAVRRLAEAREELEAAQLEHVRAVVQSGVADAAAGRFADGGVMDAARRAAARG